MPTDEVKGQQALWQALSPEEQKAVRSRLKGGNGSKPEPVVKAKSTGVFELIGYVRCDLGKSDREPFRQWQSEHSNEELMDMLVKLCDSGYLLKIGSGKEGPSATLSACDTGNGCDGYVLSSFAGDCRDAAALILYKHFVLLDGDWTPALGGTGKGTLR